MFENGLFQLSSPEGCAQENCSDITVIAPAAWFWYPRIAIQYGNAHVAAYAGQSAQGGWRFLIQPMLSSSGASAFFDVVNSELIEE